MNTNTAIALINITLLICISILFYLTESGWCFLLLLACTSTNNSKGDNDDKL